MGAEQSIIQEKTTINSEVEQSSSETTDTKPQETQKAEPERKESYQPPTPNTTPILKPESPKEDDGKKIEVTPADLTDSVDIVRKWIK
jgi:hypothetical protein